MPRKKYGEVFSSGGVVRLQTTQPLGLVNVQKNATIDERNQRRLQRNQSVSFFQSLYAERYLPASKIYSVKQVGGTPRPVGFQTIHLLAGWLTKFNYTDRFRVNESPFTTKFFPRQGTYINLTPHTNTQPCIGKKKKQTNL